MAVLAFETAQMFTPTARRRISAALSVLMFAPPPSDLASCSDCFKPRHQHIDRLISPSSKTGGGPVLHEL